MKRRAGQWTWSAVLACGHSIGGAIEVPDGGTAGALIPMSAGDQVTCILCETRTRVRSVGASSR